MFGFTTFRTAGIAIAAAALLAASAAVTAQTVERFRSPGGLVDLDFPSRSTGYALGTDTLFKSSDGGIRWNAIPFPHEGYLLSMTFRSPLTGAVVGDSGAIHLTTDGGITWAKAASGTDAMLRAVAFPGENVIVATGDRGTVVRSTDAGATWTVSAIGEGRPSLVDVDFPTPQTGYTGSVGQVFKSTDGGITWKDVNSTFGEIQDIHFISADTGFVADWYPWGIFRTLDGGVNWEWLGYNYPTHISFPSAKIGYYVTAEHEIIRTRDAGMSWNDTLHLDFPQFVISPHGLQFVDDTTGFMIADTIDGEVVNSRIYSLAMPITPSVAAVRGSDAADGELRISVENGGTITVGLPAGCGQVRVRIVDPAGRVASERSIAAEPGSTVRVETGELAAGSYIVEVTGGARRATRKIFLTGDR